MSINVKKAHGMTLSLMRETVFALPALKPFLNEQMVSVNAPADAMQE